MNVLLAVCSTLVSLTSTCLIVHMPDISEAFARTMGALGLISSALALTTLVLAMLLRRYLCSAKGRTSTSPTSMIRGHGLRFLLWFVGHSLFWVASSSICVAALLTVFGTHDEWVVASGAGFVACAIYALASTLSASSFLLPRRFETLGLCWLSPIPNGIFNLWTRASATMILHDRFERALEYDLEQSPSTYRRIVAILGLAQTGGPTRTVNLREKKLSNVLVKEWGNRFLVLAPLFILALVLALLAIVALPPKAAQLPEPEPQHQAYGGELTPQPTAISPGDGVATTPQPSETPTPTPSPSGEPDITPQPGGTPTASPPSDIGEGATPQPDETPVASSSSGVEANGTPQPDGTPTTSPPSDNGEDGGKLPGNEPGDPSKEPLSVPLPPWEPGEVIEITLLPFVLAEDEDAPGTPAPGTPFPTQPPPVGTPVPEATPSATTTPVQRIPNWIWALRFQ